jgi:hypothetical protein
VSSTAIEQPQPVLDSPVPALAAMGTRQGPDGVFICSAWIHRVYICNADGIFYLYLRT